MLNKIRSDESGATAIEYALILLLVAVLIIAGVSSIGGKVSNSFTNTTASFG